MERNEFVNRLYSQYYEKGITKKEIEKMLSRGFIRNEEFLLKDYLSDFSLFNKKYSLYKETENYLSCGELYEYIRENHQELLDIIPDSSYIDKAAEYSEKVNEIAKRNVIERNKDFKEITIVSDASVSFGDNYRIFLYLQELADKPYDDWREIINSLDLIREQELEEEKEIEERTEEEPEEEEKKEEEKKENNQENNQENIVEEQGKEKKKSPKRKSQYESSQNYSSETAYNSYSSASYSNSSDYPVVIPLSDGSNIVLGSKEQIEKFKKGDSYSNTPSYNSERPVLSENGLYEVLSYAKENGSGDFQVVQYNTDKSSEKVLYGTSESGELIGNFNDIKTAYYQNTEIPEYSGSQIENDNAIKYSLNIVDYNNGSHDSEFEVKNENGIAKVIWNSPEFIKEASSETIEKAFNRIEELYPEVKRENVTINVTASNYYGSELSSRNYDSVSFDATDFYNKKQEYKNESYSGFFENAGYVERTVKEERPEPVRNVKTVMLPDNSFVTFATSGATDEEIKQSIDYAKYVYATEEYSSKTKPVFSSNDMLSENAVLNLVDYVRQTSGTDTPSEIKIIQSDFTGNESKIVYDEQKDGSSYGGILDSYYGEREHLKSSENDNKILYGLGAVNAANFSFKEETTTNGSKTYTWQAPAGVAFTKELQDLVITEANNRYGDNGNNLNTKNIFFSDGTDKKSFYEMSNSYETPKYQTPYENEKPKWNKVIASEINGTGNVTGKATYFDNENHLSQPYGKSKPFDGKGKTKTLGNASGMGKEGLNGINGVSGVEGYKNRDVDKGENKGILNIKNDTPGAGYEATVAAGENGTIKVKVNDGKATYSTTYLGFGSDVDTSKYVANSAIRASIDLNGLLPVFQLTDSNEDTFLISKNWLSRNGIEFDNEKHEFTIKQPSNLHEKASNGAESGSTDGSATTTTADDYKKELVDYLNFLKETPEIAVSTDSFETELDRLKNKYNIDAHTYIDSTFEEEAKKAVKSITIIGDDNQSYYMSTDLLIANGLIYDSEAKKFLLDPLKKQKEDISKKYKQELAALLNSFSVKESVDLETFQKELENLEQSYKAKTATKKAEADSNIMSLLIKKEDVNSNGKTYNPVPSDIFYQDILAEIIASNEKTKAIYKEKAIATMGNLAGRAANAAFAGTTFGFGLSTLKRGNLITSTIIGGVTNNFMKSATNIALNSEFLGALLPKEGVSICGKKYDLSSGKSRRAVMKEAAKEAKKSLTLSRAGINRMSIAQLKKIAAEGKINGTVLTNEEKAIVQKLLFAKGVHMGRADVFNSIDLLNKKFGLNLANKYDITSIKGLSGILEELDNLSYNVKYFEFLGSVRLSLLSKEKIAELLNKEDLPEELRSLLEAHQAISSFKEKKETAAKEFAMTAGAAAKKTLRMGLHSAMAGTMTGEGTSTLYRPIVKIASMVHLIKLVVQAHRDAMLKSIAKKYEKDKNNEALKAEFEKRQELAGRNKKKAEDKAKKKAEKRQTRKDKRKEKLSKVKNKSKDLAMRTKAGRRLNDSLHKLNSRFKKTNARFNNTRLAQGLNKFSDGFKSIFGKLGKNFSGLATKISGLKGKLIYYGAIAILILILIEYIIMAFAMFGTIVTGVIYDSGIVDALSLDNSKGITEEGDDVEKSDLDPASTLAGERVEYCIQMDSALKTYIEQFYTDDSILDSIKDTNNSKLEDEEKLWYDPQTNKTLKKSLNHIGTTVNGINTGLHYTYYNGDGEVISMKSNSKDIVSTANAWIGTDLSAKGLYKTYVEALWNYSHAVGYSLRKSVESVDTDGNDTSTYVYSCDSHSEYGDCNSNIALYYCNKDSDIYKNTSTIHAGLDRQISIDDSKLNITDKGTTLSNISDAVTLGKTIGSSTTVPDKDKDNLSEKKENISAQDEDYEGESDTGSIKAIDLSYSRNKKTGEESIMYNDNAILTRSPLKTSVSKDDKTKNFDYNGVEKGSWIWAKSENGCQRHSVTFCNGKGKDITNDVVYYANNNTTILNNATTLNPEGEKITITFYDSKEGLCDGAKSITYCDKNGNEKTAWYCSGHVYGCTESKTTTISVSYKTIHKGEGAQKLNGQTWYQSKTLPDTCNVKQTTDHNDNYANNKAANDWCIDYGTSISKHISYNTSCNNSRLIFSDKYYDRCTVTTTTNKKVELWICKNGEHGGSYSYTNDKGHFCTKNHVVLALCDGDILYNPTDQCKDGHYRIETITQSFTSDSGCPGHYDWVLICQGHERCLGCVETVEITVPYCTGYCAGHEVEEYCTGHVDLDVGVVTLFNDDTNGLTELGIAKSVTVNNEAEYKPGIENGYEKGQTTKRTVYSVKINNINNFIVDTSKFKSFDQYVFVDPTTKENYKLPTYESLLDKTSEVESVLSDPTKGIKFLKDFIKDHSNEENDVVSFDEEKNKGKITLADIVANYFVAFETEEYKDYNDALSRPYKLSNMQSVTSKFSKDHYTSGFYQYITTGNSAAIRNLTATTGYYAETENLSRADETLKEDWYEAYGISFPGSYNNTISSSESKRLGYDIAKATQNALGLSTLAYLDSIYKTTTNKNDKGEVEIKESGFITQYDENYAKKSSDGLGLKSTKDAISFTLEWGKTFFQDLCKQYNVTAVNNAIDHYNKLNNTVQGTLIQYTNMYKQNKTPQWIKDVYDGNTTKADYALKYAVSSSNENELQKLKSTYIRKYLMSNDSDNFVNGAKVEVEEFKAKLLKLKAGDLVGYGNDIYLVLYNTSSLAKTKGKTKGGETVYEKDDDGNIATNGYENGKVVLLTVSNQSSEETDVIHAFSYTMELMTVKKNSMWLYSPGNTGEESNAS